MGHIYLAVALMAGVTKGYCGKRISGEIVTISDSCLANIGRMLICIVVGLFLTIVQDGIASLAVEASSLWIFLLSGISSALFVISWLLSVKRGAYMLVETFLLLGTCIPILFSVFLFEEKISILQTIGFVLLLIAIYIMSTYNNSIKGKMTPATLVFLCITGLANGFSDFSQKLFVKLKPENSIASFNFYTYAVAFLTLCLFYVIFKKTAVGYSKNQRIALFRKTRCYILIMAACLFINSYFKTLAGNQIPSLQLYPMNQGCSVLLSLLMTRIFFKEKITIKCFLGVGLAFVAILLINLK